MAQDTGCSIASAKASVSSFTRELATLARQQVATGAGADSALGQKMLEVVRHLDEAKESVAGLKEKLKPEGGGESGGFLGGLKKQLEGALEPIVALKENLGGMVEMIAAAFAVERIVEWVSETTEAAEKFERAAASMGVSVGEVQQLSAIAKLTGTDFGEMQTQMERLQLSLAKTGSAASPAAAALKALGINLAEFRSLTPVAQLDAMAEAFARFADGPTKTAAAIALLGKAGADMIPFLDKGKEGLEELGQVADRTGVMMSVGMIEAFSRTREDLSALSLAWTGLSQRIYAIVNPAVDAATRALTNLIEHADPKVLQSYLTELANSLVGGAANVAEFAEARRPSLALSNWRRVQEDAVVRDRAERGEAAKTASSSGTASHRAVASIPAALARLGLRGCRGSRAGRDGDGAGGFGDEEASPSLALVITMPLRAR
jgi:hypothetical protein